MGAVLETKKLTKTFGAGAGAIHAVCDVSLSVPEGVVFGVLGPNGAGKSTLLRMILGLVRPTSGAYALFGIQSGADALRKVGALIETPALYPFLTATQVLEALARTSGFAEAGRIEAVLAQLGLAHAAHRKARTFSLGMKQRLGIAAALLTRPKLLILDEPTNGMDPAGILEMRGLLRALAADEGMSVMVSSHLLDEAQRVCDHVAILDRGELIVQDAVSALSGTPRLYLDVAPQAQALTLLGPKAIADGSGVVLDVAREEGPAIVRRLVEAGVAVNEVRWRTPQLEDVFFQHTAQRRADAA